jgi:hypothetical protein
VSTPEPLTPHQAMGPVMTASRLGDVEGEKVARRNLAEAKLQTYIERVVASAPPLTPAQVNRLSALLRTGGQR